MVKKPTLFSYLRWQETALPTVTDLAREAERNGVEDATCIVVSQVTTSEAVPRTYTTQCAQTKTPKAKAKILTQAQTETLTQTWIKTWTKVGTKMGL